MGGGLVPGGRDPGAGGGGVFGGEPALMGGGLVPGGRDPGEGGGGGGVPPPGVPALIGGGLVPGGRDAGAGGGGVAGGDPTRDPAWVTRRLPQQLVEQ
jgi:collagen type III alpha